ncbi:hypothetical protein GCM10009560_70020 [Nonomuraea longicatena]|uniref:Uncharacterized protein n=1 Tax=Nonomuraea longicatena TaxID=83682 RepID=A0ABN1R1B1_9ACTN
MGKVEGTIGGKPPMAERCADVQQAVAWRLGGNTGEGSQESRHAVKQAVQSGDTCR